METEDPLWAVLKAAHAALSPAEAERFPPVPRWEPQEPEVGTAKAEPNQHVVGAVPTVPTVPTEKDNVSHCTGPEAAADAWAAWHERAGIREFDGGVSRVEAEAGTVAELGPAPPRPAGLFAN